MASGIELLRMLEPVVRPGGGTRASAVPRQPIESRSFDSILEEAKEMAQSNQDSAGTPRVITPDTGTPADSTTESNEQTTITTGNPLASLSRVDLIDNAALLRIIGNASIR